MTLAIGGLTGLVGYSNDSPEATAEERLGGTADPRHEQLGEVAQPYPWEAFPGEEHGPYGIENGLLGYDFMSYAETPAGDLTQDPTADMQPITHAAAWPKGLPMSVQPGDVLDRRMESADIHSENFGASRDALIMPTMVAQNDDWVDYWELEPGQSLQVPIPDQLKTGSGGFGSRDRVQSNARQNQYGFDSAHMHRRWADGSIPGNYMWMQPGARPLVKSVPRTALGIIPAASDTPFHGQVIGDPYNTYGAVLEDLPVQADGPITPATAPGYANVNSEAPTVDLW